jgi:nucleotide-binding universal stress UspA family protein
MEIGGAVVADVRDELETIIAGDPLPVATVVRHGDPGTAFSDLSKDARLVVLQHRSLNRLRRIFTGSKVASVATHAHCPVVSVPLGRADQPPGGSITVGVHADGGPREALESAFAEAAARGASLLVLHSDRLPTAYDDLMAADGRWAAETEEVVTAVIADLVTEHSDVTVKVEVRHEYAADTLVEVGERSDLLVVGRHGGLRGMPARLGSLPRALVAHATCPVMIVPV